MCSFDERVRRNNGYLATFIVDNRGVVTDTNRHGPSWLRDPTVDSCNQLVFAEFGDSLIR